MAQVVVVHGIGHQWSGPALMGQDVGPALRDGVRLGAGLRLEEDAVACAFYGDVFFEEGTRSSDVPPWDEYDVDEGFEAELLEAWWQAGAALDPGVVPPDESGTRALLTNRVRAALDVLSGSRFFGTYSDRMMVFALKQVRRYMNEPVVWQAARARVAEEIGPDTRVVVAHSLGSVVAYEALCEHPEWPVTDFVTVGSPLGLSLIFNRLSPLPREGKGAWPGGVARWTNLTDPGDIVAVVNELAPRFGAVVDESLDNGSAPHSLTRYLLAKKTGRAIAEGLA
ncbi:alpha/beta hydrolase [Streptomyces sp. YU58]|uniref:alpha/beta hydrolase n=1 Tax=Streptomyces sp. SX92 TaxID=3158972 RepID=UPI0027BA5501|nr:alpha/beta hydrolase [Streptomyces coralus]WLW51315.1 alpha/beta hydrolase [Streptomyces coralus]